MINADIKYILYKVISIIVGIGLGILVVKIEERKERK